MEPVVETFRIYEDYKCILVVLVRDYKLITLSTAHVRDRQWAAQTKRSAKCTKRLFEETFDILYIWLQDFCRTYLDAPT